MKLLTIKVLRAGAFLIVAIGVVGLFFSLVWWELGQLVGALAWIGVAAAWWYGFGRLLRTDGERPA